MTRKQRELTANISGLIIAGASLYSTFYVGLFFEDYFVLAVVILVLITWILAKVPEAILHHIESKKERY